jgi:hypothetical protein
MRALFRSRRGVRAAFVAAGLCVGAVTPALAKSPITINPANRPVLLSEPIEDLHYDDAQRCMHNPKPGALALQSWLQQHWRGAGWGIVRCSKLAPHDFSIHAEGRALDWHLDGGVEVQRHAAMRLIEMLLATDRDGNEAALARRMGVQGLIFNCRSWFGYGDRLGPYSYCYRRDGERRKHLNRTLAHRDHVHIELNWAGARKRTSFWRSPLAT